MLYLDMMYTDRKSFRPQIQVDEVDIAGLYGIHTQPASQHYARLPLESAGKHHDKREQLKADGSEFSLVSWYTRFSSVSSK